MTGAAGAGAGTQVLAQENFLLPNGTFFFELILFVVVFVLVYRYVVPPIRSVLTEREERIRRTQEESRQAEERREAAEKRYDEALHEARSEAASIRDEARASARQSAEQVRSQVDQEVAQVRERGERRLAEQRSQVEQSLRGRLPSLAATLAERILGRSLPDDDRRRSTVAGYLSRVEGTPSTADAGAEATASSAGER